MNIVLLQGKLEQEEIDQLLVEFPNYLFLSLSEASYKNLGTEEWKRVEVLYGNRISEEELLLAPQLRWIHTTGAHLSTICGDSIEEQGNILITTTHEKNAKQVGEFVMSGIFAFAKNLFHWKEAIAYPGLIWDSKWRDSMWSLDSKIILLIGLDNEGTEIARKAQESGLRVWGVKTRRSFHPHCEKIFTYNEINSILSSCDVICLNLHDSKHFSGFFGKERLNLMKKDSILISLGSNNVIDADALIKVAENEKFRGVLLDASYQLPIPLSSSLWKVPGIIISPGVSPRPKSKDRLAYKIFRFNLRQYTHGNFGDMRNIVPSSSESFLGNS